MDQETEERRPKRQKRDTSYKNKAFEKFKQLRSGNANKYAPEEIENVYDTVDEKEYTKRVLNRQDEDWIVDDDGSGYVEDGRDIFDDDLDKGSIAAASANKNKGTKRKKKAISEQAGKGNLQYLISNMPTKQKHEEKLEEDETLSELLGELDENTPSTSKVLKPKPISKNFSPLSVKQMERDYMKTFNRPVVKPAQLKPAVKPKVTPTSVPEAKPKEIPTPVPEIEETPTPPEVIEENDESVNDSVMDSTVPSILSVTQNEDCFMDDLDMTQIDDTPPETNKCEEIAWDEEIMKEWTTNASATTSEAPVDLEKSDIPITEVDDKKVFRFFWWDAYEDSLRQPGIVLLFGKTYHEKTGGYVSCCVAVRNIERKLFFLPRTNTEDETPVTTQDVYNEINLLTKKLGVKQFKARPISKKYAFDPTVPAESDYIEVRYSPQDPPMSKNTTGRTFSRVFGTESSYLENLLLDRKIKGPCWLDVANPIPVTNPTSWCTLEVGCVKIADLKLAQEVRTPPPLTVVAVNMRRAINPKTSANEIVMLSCVANMNYSVDKQAPDVPFQKHFCVFTAPSQQLLPMDLHKAVAEYKATTLQKMNSEKALLNYFINQLSRLDPDLIVGHDLQGYQINILSERLVHHQISTFSKLGRTRRTILHKPKLERELYLGRLVCDVKISAKELIRCRSYDLDSLCQSVLKLKDGLRHDFEPEEIARMFATTDHLLKLVLYTMQDTSYILKIMYGLNILPLALQITNIAGNVMSKTLLGGRSERNEFLLLHAFSEKDYIVPDKNYSKKSEPTKKKKPAYSGGLVLDPRVGFYDKLILLMDFNSLYPSIIQEYNICFTTTPADLTEDNMVLPDKSLPTGVLPSEIRKLVESRREVKKLMNNPDLAPDLKMQYHIRQMALKLTANSMYGCLGFSHSRFYAKALAALVTHKGREILTNTQSIVERMSYDVIYGDTDSLMINTNIVDYEQVFKIGNKIKQEINKLYKQVELDIDGVFKYLLLLKKKKYAAVTLTKTRTGELKTEVEYKGLDIVRRDWSRLASEAGKYTLNQILSEQTPDDRVNNIYTYLRKLKTDLEEGHVPLSLLVITKQLTKNPNLYADPTAQPHVQVALRYNKESGGHFRAGDTVPYLICEDGTTKSATQRAYHVEELKNSATLKIDVKYYLSQQIHPVVSRICEPIEELDVYQLADCLGVDISNLKKHTKGEEVAGENIVTPEFKFRSVDKFTFKCRACKSDNVISGAFVDNISILEKCANPQCTVRPVDYVPYIQNQLIKQINKWIDQYYLYEMECEDPMCNYETRRVPMNFHGRRPVCTQCQNCILLKKYTESDLYLQLSFFQYIFTLSEYNKRPLLEQKVEKAFQDLKDTVDARIAYSGYAEVDLTQMFSLFAVQKKNVPDTEEKIEFEVDDESDNELE